MAKPTVPVKLSPDRFIAIDTETTGPNTHKGDRPFMVQTCDSSGVVRVWQWHVDLHRCPHIPSRDIQEIKSLLDEFPCYVFHNSLFDVAQLQSIGIDLTQSWHRIDDTLSMSHVLDSGEVHGLKPLAVKYLNMPETDESSLQQSTENARRYAKSKLQYALTHPLSCDHWLSATLATLVPLRELHANGIDPEAAEQYGSFDAIRTAALYKIFCEALHDESLLAPYAREKRILPIAYKLNQSGARLHYDALQHYSDRLASIASSASQEIRLIAKKYGLLNLNVNSPKQLRQLLFYHLELQPISFTPAANEPSTSASDIAALYEKHFIDEPRSKRRLSPFDRDRKIVLESLITYSRYQTAVKYLANYQKSAIPHTNPVNKSKEYRLHSNYNPSGTAFTRFSSSGPNLQNVGARDAEIKLRSVFGPGVGWEWWCMDYNQLELRIGAVLSNDRTMLEALATDADLHQITADVLGCSRKQAKNINFAWWYGAGDSKLSRMAGLDAHEFNHAMRSRYPGVVDFMAISSAEAYQNGYIVTRFGYRCSIPPEKSYVSVNGKVQGTAGDIMKNAMILIDDYLAYQRLTDQIIPIINVHDELVFEVRTTLPSRRYHLAQIRDLMQQAGNDLGIHTPVNCEVCRHNWSESEPDPLTNIRPPSSSRKTKESNHGRPSRKAPRQNRTRCPHKTARRVYRRDPPN